MEFNKSLFSATLLFLGITLVLSVIGMTVLAVVGAPVPGTLETIVFDLTKREVKTRIPTPNGGDTHSGAFVRYGADFTGELLADQGGVHQGMLAEKMALVAPGTTQVAQAQ